MRRRFLLSMLAGDLLSLAAALAIASIAVFETPWFWNATLPLGESIWPMVDLLVVGALAGSYISVRMWGQGIPRPSYGRALAIVGTSLGLTSLGLLFVRSAYYSRPFLAITFTAWAGLALAHRAIRRRRPWVEPMVLVTHEKGLAEDLHDAPHSNVLSVLEPAALPPSEPIGAGTVLVVDLRSVLSDPMAQFVSSCNLAGVPVRSLNNVYEEHTGRLAIVHLAEGWEVATPVASRADYTVVKRILDTILVVITSPLWILLAAVIALAVRIDSPGPIIYKQNRVGRGGSQFTLYKFRTMDVDAEQHGPRFAAESDERLTRVGKALRRFRVDEVPQLWNVFKGDLSLVGPRPERPIFVEEFSDTIPFYAYRHLVRPGVTGWAQVNYGYADDLADTVEKLTYDLYYLKHMSPWLDLNILGRSLWTVVSGFGAQ
jgi:lipopolysaccharide/colanic/teichoic acid biosynthesis glycosyltransferase